MTRRMRLVVSVSCGLVSLVACLAYAGTVRGEVERARSQALARYGGEVVSLVVASRPIEAGEVVGTTDVSMRDWISTLAPSRAMVDVSEVLGREVTVPVADGAPLTELNFRDATELADIPSGHVAVSVPITDRLAISPAVRVGSHVIAYQAADEGAQVICADALVLSVPGNAATLGARGSLTIAVSSEDVPRVLSASTAGDLRLVVPADDVKSVAKGDQTSKDVPPADKGGEAHAKDE